MNMLLIEDDEPTRTMFSKRLAQEFPRAVVDTAGTATEARAHIERMQRAGKQYHCIVQDLKIPEAVGENPEFDETIWPLVKRSMERCFFVYITAYAKEDPARDLMRRQREDSAGSLVPGMVVKEGDWHHDVIGLIRSKVESPRLEKEFERWFGVSPADAGGRGSSGMSRGSDLQLASDLDELCLDLQANWKYLDDRFKKRVRDRLVVEESDLAHVRIGLR